MRKIGDNYPSFNLYCQDESRYGTQTHRGRILTAKGVKAICTFKHEFENTYLYGAFSPIDGSSLVLDLPYCDSDCFQIFIDELSQLNPKEYKLVLLDNGAFHKSKQLQIPKNMTLIFLPPYSPELNPAEKVWWVLKEKMKCKNFKNLKILRRYLYQQVRKIVTPKNMKQLCSYDFLINILD